MGAVSVFKAKALRLPISHRKVALATDCVRGMNAADAICRLRFVNKKSLIFMRKLIVAAAANAQNLCGLDASELCVGVAYVGRATCLRRIMARARGRAARIIKHRSNIFIELHKGRGGKDGSKS